MFQKFLKIEHEGQTEFSLQKFIIILPLIVYGIDALLNFPLLGL